MHLHDAYAGGSRARSLQRRVDGLCPGPVPVAKSGGVSGIDETGTCESAGCEGAILHDGAGAEGVARRQCGERAARASEPAHVAMSVSPKAGGAGADWAYYQWDSFAWLDEGNGAAFLAAEVGGGIRGMGITA